MNFFNKVASFVKKYAKWVLSALALIILLLIFRSCSTDAIAHKEVYVIARASSWYPLELYGREKNVVGFTNDLLSLIMKNAGVRFRWAESSPNFLLEGLNDEAFDGIVSPLRPDVVNQEAYYFSELLLEIGPVLIVRKDSPITSLQQMQDLMIGILKSSSLLFNAIRMAGANSFDLTFVRFDNSNQALDALMKHQIDGVILSTIPAYTFSEGFYAENVKIISAPLNDDGLRLITHKTPLSLKLVEEFNAALDKLKEDKTYDALLKKWNLINPTTRFQSLPPGN